LSVHLITGAKLSLSDTNDALGKGKEFFPIRAAFSYDPTLWRLHKITALAALFKSGSIDADKSAGEPGSSGRA
jgi:hypothetical protein